MITVNENHEYLKDNLIVIPSVSQLVQYATGEDYSNIPPHILANAAEFGTTIHDAIEDYLTDGTETQFYDDKLNNSWSEFMRLKDEYIGKENVIETQIDFEEKYAGRIDLLSGTTLIDFKTNAKFDDSLEKHLEWQLGYYKLALVRMGYRVSECYCLYLPKKGQGMWVPIEPKPEIKLKANYDNYVKSKRDFRFY